MKRSLIVLVMLVGAVILANQQATKGQAPAAPAGRGPSPEVQAAMAKQDALEKATPQLQITEEVLNLQVPNHTIGETTGVAKDSKGNLYVFTRSGNAGPARGATASQLYEFDPTYKFIKQWGTDNYAASFAHTVRVDRNDNVWMTDEGSGMVVKFNPAGRVMMVLGRKPEAIDFLEKYLERGEKDTERAPVGNMGSFNRPTDVAFDSQDNIFVADGYGNSRFVKINKEGEWQKVLGTRGAGPNQFNTVHGIAVDAKNNVYVADRGNRRIQVFDNNMTPKAIFSNVAAPWTVCATPGPTQYIYSGDGTGKLYKLDMNGKLLGWAQTTKGHGQTGCLIHSIHCESENVIYKGDCSTWTVEKITIKSGGAPSQN